MKTTFRPLQSVFLPFSSFLLFKTIKNPASFVWSSRDLVHPLKLSRSTFWRRRNMFRSLWFPRLRKSSGDPSHWLYKVLQLSTINQWKIHSTWAKLPTYHWFWCHIANLQFYWQAAKMQKEETFLILWLLLVKVYFQFLVKKIMIFALIILSQNKELCHKSKHEWSCCSFFFF